MQRAIDEALKVTKDVPVGAIIVKNNDIIAAAHNMKEVNQDVTSHAEILAIQDAQKILKAKYLDDCEIFVTLEPCPMCMWAILQSRIKTLYFGSYDRQYGGITVCELNKIAHSNIKIYGGIMEKECDTILEDFFKGIRC